ncbi:CoA transferase [Acrocarpospora pleiomorpha]|uniref:CoA transferase n=1 Tax=Acrocarpospora pleiomorpha TaxID=90975 RepID=A0A5M3XIJ8_9ACTN|nr:CaiB/BaiF CoA-transferase family protein [Acrocarpospora pleiomorpha]GES19511.1 CoA transferase [Acrocarpospora pleiomorpha]
MNSGPLNGVRVVELGGIGPAPFACMMLADLGADVIRIDRPGAELHPVLHRSRRSIALDLKSERGRTVALRMIEAGDIVIEGFRPGVAERLGIGPSDVHRAHQRVVYGRMTGWGQDGPWARLPGHDINYIALTGALHAIGPAGGDPVVPLNLIGDFGGGGMLLAYGVLAALVSARTTGRGQVVDAAMIDGSAALMAMLHGYLVEGRWVDQRGVNHLDGAAPYYRTYECGDGRHVAVGCIEPQFYAALLEGLELSDDPAFSNQEDRDRWPVMIERLREKFASRSRDEWADVFATSSACVTPVLSMNEAPLHPHHAHRQTYVALGSGHMPRPVPRFDRTPAGDPRPAPTVGSDGAALLAELGMDQREVRRHVDAGAVVLPSGLEDRS